MPSKIKNAIGTGDVNVGFSAALRNPPVPEEKLVATLEYDDIGPRSNTGGYQFYRGTIPYLGRITDILQANNVRLGHTNSSNENVEAILNKRVRGETLRWEINSSNYIDWIVSSAVRARNNEHEFNITLKENGITNITTQSSNSHQFVDFKFYAVELVPDAAPPVPGQFGVFRWQSADYVNPQGAVNPGDIELSSNNREVDHLTNDNVEDVDVIGIEYENGTDLAQFVNSLNVGSALIIYRDNQNVVKYNITASAPNRPAGANLFVRLDVSYADHHLGADGLDATGVDIPVHLGRLAGLSGSSGGGNMNRVGEFLDSEIECANGNWTTILSPRITPSSSNSKVLIDTSVGFRASRPGVPHPIALRVMAGNTVVRQLGGPDDLIEVNERADGVRVEPVRLRAVHNPSGVQTYDVDVYTTSSWIFHIWPLRSNIIQAYDGSTRERISEADIDFRDINFSYVINGETYNPLRFGIVAYGDTMWLALNYLPIGNRPTTSVGWLKAFNVNTKRATPSLDAELPFNSSSSVGDIAIAGREIWVVNEAFTTAYAYNINNSGVPVRNSSRDFSLPVPIPRQGNKYAAVASDPLDRIWIHYPVDNENKEEMRAWDISGSGTPTRSTSDDFLLDDTINPNSAFTDGVFMWEIDRDSNAFRCYNLASGERESAMDFSGLTSRDSASRIASQRWAEVGSMVTVEEL